MTLPETTKNPSCGRTTRRLLLLAFLTGLAGFAAAADPPDTPTADAWTTNGTVNSILVDGDITYIGGSFTYIGPPPDGSVDDGIAFAESSGEALAGAAAVGGVVRAVAADGAGGWYIGGDFTQVGGSTHNRIAHLRSDGSLDPAWTADVDNTVRALAVSGERLYVGGDFSTIDGAARARIAALRTDTGEVITAWDPTANGTVNALVLSGDRLYVGGQFTQVGGQARNRIAALDPAAGTATTWNPGANGPVYALAVGGTRVYAGGSFSLIGGQTRYNLAALDATTDSNNATPWSQFPSNGPVNALLLDGTTLYTGGGDLAAFDPTTGSRGSWSPAINGVVNTLALRDGAHLLAGGAFTTISGLTCNGLAAVDLVFGLATNLGPGRSGTINALAASGTAVFAGGDLTRQGGVNRGNLAAVLTATGQATGFNPDADGSVLALAKRDAQSLLVGGTFSHIGGSVRNALALLSADGRADSAWDPNVKFVRQSGMVRALAVHGTTIYLGGWFDEVGGLTRQSLAALAWGGQVLAWNPDVEYVNGGSDTPNCCIYALAANDSTVYAGGYFNRVGGAVQYELAVLDAVTGGLNAWHPNSQWNKVRALILSGSTLYVGGEFWTIAGQPRAGLAAFDTTTGNLLNWNPGGGSVYALALDGTTLYAGGSFSSAGGVTRNGLAALDTTQDTPATPWNPNANNSVYAIGKGPGTLFAGGSFSAVGGQPRGNLARFGPTLDLVAVDLRSTPTNDWHQLMVDGTAYWAPQTFYWPPGSVHTLDALSVNEPDEHGLFVAWSDGGAQSHQVTIPATPTTYTAGYSRTEYKLTVTAGTGGRVLTPSGNWYPHGATTNFIARADDGYKFSYWRHVSGNAWLDKPFSAATPVIIDGSCEIVAQFRPVRVDLALTITGKTGAFNADRAWEIKFSNNGTTTVTAARISSFTLSSSGSCHPAVVWPALPLDFGDISAGGAATRTLKVGFAGCAKLAKFNVRIEYSANGGTISSVTDSTGTGQ